MNLKKILSLSLALVVLATVAVLTGTSTVGASPHINSLIAVPPPPSVPVSVVNTPLPVTGTVNANIGTPTVNANVLGTPNVNAAISGVPNVHVNTDSGTPLVVDPDGASVRNSVSGTCGPTNFNQFGEGGCSMFTVPPGFNLVVETVSEQVAGLTTSTGEYIQHMEVGAENGNLGPLVLIGSYLVPAQVGTNGVATWYAGQAPVRLYYGPSTVFGCSVQVFGGTGGSMYCAFTGHLSPL